MRNILGNKSYSMRISTYTPFHYLLFLLFLISGCSEPLTRSSYLRYFDSPEHGFIKVTELGDIELCSIYLAPERLCFQEGDFSLSGVSEYSGSLNFQLQLRAKSSPQVDVLKELSTDYASYSAIVEELSFSTESLFALEVSDQVLSPTIAHYERGITVSGVQTLHVSFERPLPSALESGVTLVFESSVLGISRTKFHYDINELKVPPIPKS